MIVRPFEPKDIDQICDIYNYYILNTVITFEEIPLTAAQMLQRIESYTKRYPWLVCEGEGSIVGYAYASKWKERSAYNNTAEITVYLKNSLARKGYGKALYSALLASLEQQNCHVALACISLPNQPSEKFHESFGFEKVAHFSEVGSKFDRWLDVGYWQKILISNV